MIRPQVDIIIPIYNAYDATKECVESVIASTDLNYHRLILINDQSPDERIDPLLEGFAKDHSDLNITVLKNEKNLGFVGTVNRGMHFSENDVLLLNSDTVVSKNWLEKIIECGQSSGNVATVTPLSNNATLVSVPNGLTRNEVLEKLSLEEYNDLIEKCSFKDYPELPTAHGFCMYIKREALNTIGFFDEKSFGTGYGEENDFSFRCLDFGFKNLLCDDTLVYHKESQSFNNKRSEVIEAHLAIIAKRFPQYENLTESWCQSFPIQYICDNIKVNLQMNDRKNVLMPIHEMSNTVGGTTLHLLDIVNSLRKEMNFHILYPQGDHYAIHSYFENEEHIFELPYVIKKYSLISHWNSDYKKMVNDIVSAFAIDTVHIHHMIGHYFDIADIIKERKLNSLITLHDYYCVCPNHNLLFCGEKYCRNEKAPDCRECMITTRRASYDLTQRWRIEWNKFLSAFDKVIVPSDDAKSIVSSYYPDIQIESIEHGINIEKSKYIPDPKDEFNVAFIGVMCKHKGGYLINEIISKCKNQKIHFHVFGKSELPELEKSRSNYSFHGEYKRSELYDLLHKNNIHLICFMQIWPETYSYTLNEAIGAGIPVLTTNIGAGKDRVKKYKFGFVADSLNAGKIIGEIEEISENKEKYRSAVKAISEYKIKTIPEMASQYESFYSSSDKKTPDYKMLGSLIKEKGKTVGYDNSIENELMMIKNSLKWKLIGNLHLPYKFRSKLKTVYSKIKKIRRK